MSHSSYRNLLGNSDHFLGEDDPTPPEYEPTAEDLDQWEREAAAEAQAYAEDAENERQASVDLCNDLDRALTFLTDCHGGDDCDGEVPVPVRVIEVFEAHDGFPTSMNARAACGDGRVRRVRAFYSLTGGSWDDPPDVDVEFDYYCDEEYQ